MTKHSPEPWRLNHSGYLIDASSTPVDGRIHNLQRAADCVNALAGYNPDALAGLVDAARPLADTAYLFDGADLPGRIRDDHACTIPAGELRRIRNALAALEAHDD